MSECMICGKKVGDFCPDCNGIDGKKTYQPTISVGISMEDRKLAERDRVTKSSVLHLERMVDIEKKLRAWG